MITGLQALDAARRAGFHFGWWDADGRPHEGGTAKAVRPALVLTTARALDADVTTAPTVADADELVHNFTR